MVIYVGKSQKVINRIITNHCKGNRANVEGSALRKHVAQAIGYGIKSTKRSSGTTKVRIDLPNPREGEVRVSNYIRSGKWRYIICNSYDEARGFEGYVIEQLKPLLNKDFPSWDNNNLQKYQILLTQLRNSPASSCTQLKGMQTGPGVYILYHKRQPERGRQERSDTIR